MAAAINCEKCGLKIRPGRDRCPRCRTVIAAPDPAQAEASSRRLATAAAVLGGTFVLGLGVLWLVRGQASAAAPVVAPAASVVAPSLAAAAPVPADPATPLPPIGRDRPFLDPAGAGAVAYAAGDYAASLVEFQRAIERNPQDADALSNLGQVLVRMNRPADAVPYLERAATLSPQEWTYQFNLARALGLVGRLAESVQGYRRAQEIFPGDFVTTFNLALALHKAGDEAAAVEQYQKAIALRPEDASFRLALANSYERLQKRPEAAAAYQEYLRLSPAAPDADRVRARIVELTASAPAAPAPEPARF